MNDTGPFAAIEFTKLGPAIGIDLRIEPIEIAIRQRGPHMVGHRLRQQAEPRFAFSRRHLCQLLVGNVVPLYEDAVDRPVGPAHRLVD